MVETWAVPHSEASPPRRRWPLLLVTVVAVIAAVVATAVAVQQRGVAADWRDRTEATQDELDRTSGVVDQLQAQVDRTTGLLEASEADVRDLEERIRVLAGEKAQAEDDASVLDVESDVVSDLVGRLATASDELDVCVMELFDLQEGSVAAFNASSAGEPIDTAALNQRAAEVTGRCNDARDSAAAAGAAAEQLVGR